MGARVIIIGTADLALCSFFLPEGRHHVVMTYEPWSFGVGLWATVATFTFVVVFAALRSMLKRR